MTTTTNPVLQFMDDVLQLIEEGASPQRLHETRSALRPTLATAAERAQLDAIYERTLRLREAEAERRRRELELGVLVETAADLSGLHELSDVLAAICRSVRSLLSTDAAWITLVDPERGDTYHCMTDGIVADAQVRTHRLSAGTGLGGLVLETGRAEWTDNYVADQRFAHSPPIDRTASDEGLGAMLGAPMRRGDELLGIVITANRGHRRFVAQHVMLLQTLADHAAIAIANARLLSMSTSATIELRAANATIRQHAENIERSVELRTRLSQLVLDGSELRELLVPIAEVFDGQVTVLDAGRHVLATTGSDYEASQSSPHLTRALQDVLSSGRPSAVAAENGHQSWLLAPMLARREPVGALMLSKPGVAEADLRLLESAALPLALFLANAQAQADAERVVRGELLTDLIAGNLSSVDTLVRRARSIGWDHSGTYVLVVVDPGDEDARWMRLSANRLASELGGLMSERDGEIVLLIPGSDATAVSAEIARRLRSGSRTAPTVAAARPVGGYELAPAAFAQAQKALGLALALGRCGTTVLAEATDAYGLIFGSAQPKELASFIQRTLGAVLDHDRDRRGDLIQTLEAWFACDGHMGNTAQAAHVHVNTLYKRMERIDQLLGVSWRQSDRRLEVQLALRLRTLAADLGHEADS